MKGKMLKFLRSLFHGPLHSGQRVVHVCSCQSLKSVRHHHLLSPNGIISYEAQKADFRISSHRYMNTANRSCKGNDLATYKVGSTHEAHKKYRKVSTPLRQLQKFGFMCQYTSVQEFHTSLPSRDHKDSQDDDLLKDPEMKLLLEEIAKDFNGDEEKAKEYLRDQDMSSTSGGKRDAEKVEVHVIDIDEELQRYDYEEFEEYEYESADEWDEEDVSAQPSAEYKRGTTGVFDIDELVDLLSEENGRNICVIKVPEEIKYVDFMAIVTGRSTRHILAIAEKVRWIYKKKRRAGDAQSVNIEGKDTCKDWFAMDLGNIALHIFLQETRDYYDLETLWTVGDGFPSTSEDIIDVDVDDPFAIFLDPKKIVTLPKSDDQQTMKKDKRTKENSLRISQS